MTSRIPKPRPVNIDRNQAIWTAYANGAPQSEIGREHGLTEQRISQIVKQVAAGIPEEDRTQIVKLHRSYLDQAKTIAMEIALSPAKPSFAPNGKPLVGVDGKPILDNSERLSAVQTALKADERLARLTGTDAPTQTQHAVVEASEAVQAAARHEAEKVKSQFPTLFGVAS